MRMSTEDVIAQIKANAAREAEIAQRVADDAAEFVRALSVAQDDE